MRGKAEFAKAEGIHIGITPAYAGKSVRYTHHRAAGWDHPRLCGEKFQKNRRSPCYKGSPPPMRGKVDFEVFKYDWIGITPAYAGKRHHSSCIQQVL